MEAEKIRAGHLTCVHCKAEVYAANLEKHQQTARLCREAQRLELLASKGWTTFDRRAVPLVAAMGLPYTTVWRTGPLDRRSGHYGKSTPEAHGPSAIELVLRLVTDEMADSLWTRRSALKTWQLRDQLRRRALRAIRQDPNNLKVMYSLDALGETYAEVIAFLREFSERPVCEPVRNEKGFCLDEGDFIPNPTGEN